ncbi:MAG: SGNH/GDSL hydrolase family protein [Ignavibacteriaceae bacterium]
MIKKLILIPLLFTCVNIFAQYPDSLVRIEGDTIWYDARCFTIEGKGWTDTDSAYDRLPARAKDIVPERVWRLSKNSAGISVSFSTNSKTIFVKWTNNNAMYALPNMPAISVSGVDLYSRVKDWQWKYIGTGRPNSTFTSVASFNAEGDYSKNPDYLLNLPLYNGIKKLEIGIPNGSDIFPASVFNPEIKPILFYGTSITQGGSASRPGLVHTALIQRRLNIRIINLGFSGSGKMEIEMAKLISEIDASLYILDCLWNMTDDLVNERGEAFIRYLKSKRPETPILLVEDSKYNYSSPSPRGVLMKGIYDKLMKEGIEGIYFLEGKNLLGDDGEGTIDGVHPNDIGFQRHTEEFIKAINRILFKK